MSQLVRLEGKHTVWTAHCAMEGKIHEYNNKYNWLADERTRWWFACWCSGVARWIIQEGTAATAAAVALPVDVSFETFIKRSLSSSMTMKTMIGFADLEWISMEWYMPGSRKKRNHFVEYKNKTGWKVYSSPVVAWKGRGGNSSVEHCSGVAYLVFVDLCFIFCIMRGVLREKVKKKTKATQSIAKVLMATNMSSKSHKFNF